MPRLYQLPDGNWVDLKRVIAVEAVEFSSTQSYVKVCFQTIQEGFIRVQLPTFAAAVKARDEIAAAVNALESIEETALDMLRQRQKLGGPGVSGPGRRYTLSEPGDVGNAP
jgi:hypothetical protein